MYIQSRPNLYIYDVTEEEKLGEEKQRNEHHKVFNYSG